MADEVGRNEQVWRQFSKELLDIAMTWPVDKQVRFTRHAKFENLLPSDQALLFQAIEAALPSARLPPRRRAEQRPAPPRSSRRPAPVAPASRRVSLKLPWHRSAFVAASLRAVAWWGATMVVGDLVLKFMMGAN